MVFFIINLRLIAFAIARSYPLAFSCAGRTTKGLWGPAFAVQGPLSTVREFLNSHEKCDTVHRFRFPLFFGASLYRFVHLSDEQHFYQLVQLIDVLCVTCRKYSMEPVCLVV